jgi:hypothetical protein
LWSDGTFVGVGDASDYLCWGTRRDESHPLRLNPLGLAETTYLFMELSRRVLVQSRTPLRGAAYYMGLHRMTAAGRRALLAPHGIRTSAHRFGMRVLEAPEANMAFRAKTEEPTNTGAVVYDLLGQVYARFDHDADAIPYVSERNGRRVIDPEKLVADGQGG